MFWLQSVESKEYRIQLSKGATVGVLVFLAIWSNILSVQRVAEIRREIAFREEMSRNLDQLTLATESIAQRKQQRANPVLQPGRLEPE